MKFYAATVLVLASTLMLAGCHDPDDFLATPDSFLTLEADGGATTLPADGFSELMIEARLIASDAPTQRQIEFSTTRGGWVGAASGVNAITVDVDQNATSRATLKSDSTPGEVTVGAMVVGVSGVSRSLTLMFTPPDPDETIEFIDAPTNAPADGATRSTFRVGLNDQIPNPTVTFTTTIGKFSNGMSSATVNGNDQNQAAIELIGPTAVGTGIVSATILGITRTTTITFDPALPDRILVIPDALSVAAGADVRVSGQLLRDIGMTTVGTVPTFESRDAAGNILGGFLSLEVSNAQATVAARYLPGTTAYRGPVTVTVGVLGSSVTGSTTIQVVAPPASP